MSMVKLRLNNLRDISTGKVVEIEVDSKDLPDLYEIRARARAAGKSLREKFRPRNSHENLKDLLG